MQKKYFFFDYDGTIALPHTYNVPDDTLKTLEALKAAGHFLSLATGRLQADAIQFLDALPFKNAVADGGNSITLEGKLVYMEPLDYEPTLKCLRALDAAGYEWAVIPENKLVRYTPFPHFNEGLKYFIPTEYVKGLTPENFKQFYKIYVKVQKGAAEEALVNSAPMQGIPWCSSALLNQIFIEPTQKAEGIKKVMEILDAPVKDVVVFGDGNNDVSMFSDAWVNIAMGNAIEELKKSATYITTNVDAGGIYNACKHFGWI